jgi:bifunctional non-homologous end joining protein LigD
LACAYSLRPYPGATVSTPLEWSEVKNGLDPSKFNIKTIQKRIAKKGDLWKGVLKNGVDLHDAIKRLE